MKLVLVFAIPWRIYSFMLGCGTCRLALPHLWVYCLVLFFVLLMVIIMKYVSPVVRHSCATPNLNINVTPFRGGYKYVLTRYTELVQYIVDGPSLSSIDLDVSRLGMQYTMICSDDELDEWPASSFFRVRAELNYILPLVSAKEGRDVARRHGISCGLKCPKDILIDMCLAHSCDTSCCLALTYIFKYKIVDHFNKPKAPAPTEHECNDASPVSFPPPLPNRETIHAVISSASNKFQPAAFEEVGCAVCGQLVLTTKTSALKSVKRMLHVLQAADVTRIEHKIKKDVIREFSGPVIDFTTGYICDSCRKCVREGKVPRYALCKGLWIGNVPKELQGLRYVEKLLIARVRYSTCFVRVSSGMRKMIANAVSFESPVGKVYERLPISKAELDEVLVVLFTGPKKPSAEDFKRTPLLVRSNKVKLALEWLVLNHGDYYDVDIDYNALSDYDNDGESPPVVVVYRSSESAKASETPAVFDMESEDGTEKGPCPFVLHGLSASDLQNMDTKAIKSIVLDYFNKSGKVLAIGRANDPESLWHNPQLYPQMFPWLFPYGLRGIGLVSGLSHTKHKQLLLMYHDKWFQTDPAFPFIAFSHEQIRASSQNAFLMAGKEDFKSTSNRVMDINARVLADLSNHMRNGEIVKPVTDDARACFALLKDIDHVAGAVNGSVTSKKYMRNQLWSLIYHVGSPIWYITLSPVDVKHPLCVYLAGTDQKFSPKVKQSDERMRLVTLNPVAGARFFKYAVQTFISDVLGFNNELMPGLYGDVEAYYGTVEQQGRLTLHLHG